MDILSAFGLGGRRGSPADLEAPVLIAGAGPVGMTLALELARYGVRSLLAERNPTTTQHPKMDLINGRSMELFHRLGLAEKFRDAGVPRENCFDVSWVTSPSGYELHRFAYPSANQARERIAACNDGSQASEPGLRVSQIVIEPILMREAEANPLIEVRSNTSFERIESADDKLVMSVLLDRATGQEIRVRSQFLAGCDGGGSRVREEAGIALEGDFSVASAYMVHFKSKATDILQRFGVTWHVQSGSGILIAQDDKDTYTLQRWLLPDDRPEEMRGEDVLREWVGADFDFQILRANPWSAHLVVAESFRCGQRIVLAGDSAHQVIPTGGYGMNSGIGDAVGLAWVLAANLQGWGGVGLVEAYDVERRNTAWWYNQASREHMGVRVEIGRLYAEAGDIESAAPEAAANRASLAKAIEAIGNAENESWGVELGYRYDQSPIIVNESDKPAVDKLNYQPSTMPGARLPHLFLEGRETRLHDLLGEYFTLIVFSDVEVAAFEHAAAKTMAPLKILRLDNSNLVEIYERDLLLVRPDQHIAWRGNAVPEDVSGLLEQVIGIGGARRNASELEVNKNA